MRLLRSTRGDTIIEVLIAIAVVSLVLAGAYAATSRSLNTTRQAQEHTEALKLAEGQLESLRSMSSNNAIYTTGSGFCINAGTITTGAGCIFTNGIPYTISVDRVTSGSTFLFTVSVTWDNVHGNGRDQVAVSYKLSD